MTAALRVPASLPTKQAVAVLSAFERAATRLAAAKLAALKPDLGLHEAAHAVNDALAAVDECNARITAALAVLYKANDLLACGDALGELSGLHDELACAAASAAARFAELTGELRRRIMAKLGIEEPEPAPDDFEETFDADRPTMPAGVDRGEGCRSVRNGAGNANRHGKRV